MPDIYSAGVAVYEDVLNNPGCYGPFGILYRVAGSCSALPNSGAANSISPVIVSPAAPRSNAELTSGLWTPEDVERITREKLTEARLQRQAIYAAGGNNVYVPSPEAEASKLKAEDWILIGGLFIAGLAVVKSIVR